MNQEVTKYLRMWVNEQQDDWVEWLALAEFALNNRKSASGFSPFELNYGHDPRMGVNTTRANNESAEQFAERMRDAWSAAKTTLEKVATVMKKTYDKC